MLALLVTPQISILALMQRASIYMCLNKKKTSRAVVILACYLLLIVVFAL